MNSAMGTDAASSIAEHERLHRFAHDLRNRLAGMHQALKHVAGEDDPDKEEFVRFGEQQFFKAMREIEKLMDDLHVVRDVQKFEADKIQLSEVVKEAADLLAHRLEKKQQELVLRLDDRLEVIGDRHYITEAVAALLSNASKFSPYETPIEVMLERKGDFAELCVIDKGVGMTADDLKQIFVRYAWLNSRTTNGEAQGRSTIARAHQWLNGMGGKLEASSEGEGTGCSFSMHLPLAKDRS